MKICLGHELVSAKASYVVSEIKEVMIGHLELECFIRGHLVGNLVVTICWSGYGLLRNGVIYYTKVSQESVSS